MTALVLSGLAAACGGPPPTKAADAASQLPAAPAGTSRHILARAPDRSLNLGMDRPSDAAAALYRLDEPPGAAITLTYAIYATTGAALSAYNSWFATYGFMPSSDRSPVGAGDTAERFDVGWPPLHAVIARRGSRFVLVEASPEVPDDRRTELLDGLTSQALPR